MAAFAVITEVTLPVSNYKSCLVKLRDALKISAQQYSSNFYLRHQNTSLTYLQVDSTLSTIASQLPVLEGLRVIILLPDGLSAALLHLECFLQGATIVPLSPFAPVAHIQYVVEKIQPDLVITTPVLRAKFTDLLRKAGIVLVDGGSQVWVERELTFDQKERKRSPVRAVFFTSGTTGQPKGVCLSESNLLSAALINQSILQLDFNRRSLITVPLWDYYGFIQIYSHAMAGASCTLGENGQFPKSAFEIIESHTITDVVLVPFTLKAFVDFAKKSKERIWHKMRYIASSSDRLTPDLLKEAFALNPELTIVNVYGLTEAGRACYRVIRSDSAEGDSIGKPSPSMKVWVDAPLGQTGEILISGPTTMLGYFKSIQNNEIRFDSAKETRTSDEGYVGGNGEIYLLGRKDHLMSLHGVKLHPSEIELVVNQFSGVKDSRARLHQDEQGNKSVLLEVVADHENIDQTQILDRLRERVPRVFLPQVIRFVDSLERTEIGGKLIRPKSSANG